MAVESQKDVAHRILHRHEIVLGAIVLMLIIPYVVLSVFCHPQNDDYVFAEWTMRVGYIQANIRWYDFWTGRYFSTALASMNPLIWKSIVAYKAVAMCIVVITVVSLYFFVASLLGKAVPRTRKFLISGIISSIYLYNMPAVKPGLYWMTGSMTYQMGNILFAFLLGWLIRMLRAESNRQRTLSLCLSCPLAFLASGTNEVTMILVLLLTAFAVVCGSWEQRTLHRPATLVFFVSLFSSIFVLKAPGTALRSGIVQHNMVQAATDSFLHGITYSASWLFFSPLLLFALLLVPFIANRPLRYPQRILNPFFCIAMSVVLYFGLFFPPLYSTGQLAARTVNCICFIFHVGFFLNMYLVICHYARCAERLSFFRSRQFEYCILLSIVVIFSLGSSNTKSVYGDLLTGRALRFDREMNERYRLIGQCQAKVCEVPPLTVLPVSLHFFSDPVDEQNDPDYLRDYKDSGYAAYFGKERVKIGHGSL